MRARRLSFGLLVLMAAVVGVAAAATYRSSLSEGRTFRLKAETTRTFRAGYPDALKYGRSKYSGRVRILMPSPSAHGGAPSLAEVHVVSKGACEGGSDFCARVDNSNRVGTAAVRVRVSATTKLPPGKQR